MVDRHTGKNNKKENFGTRLFVVIAAVIFAIAIAVSCIIGFSAPAKVGVENVGHNEVRTSASSTYTTADTYDFNSATGSINDNAVGKLKNDDVLTFNYANSSSNTSSNPYTVILPRGTFEFDLYGARGGGHGGDAGATGARAYGTATFSSAVTLYLYCGGVGTNSENSRDASSSRLYAGGWNGGGSGSGNGGPGGGGATDIRYGGTSLGNRIIVAAGGGGSSSAGGVDGATSNSNGTSGVGTSGCAGKVESTSYPSDEGGGGGGYYGGTVAHGDDTYRGYAGTNYVNTDYFTTNSGNEYGKNASSGRVVITVKNVNESPKSKSYVSPVLTRGDITHTIAASDLARDPDPVTGQTEASVYFTNGSSDGYDTFSRTADAGLYLNAECNETASKYFSWSWSADNKSFTINKVVSHPRTANGEVTVYTKIRDAYGDTRTRGVSTISFTLKVGSPTINYATSVSVRAIPSTGAAQDAECIIGSSKPSAAKPTDPKTVTADTLYNPVGGNRYTIFIKKTLMLNEKFTLDASRLLTGIASEIDVAAIELYDTANFSGASKYRVVDYDERASTPTAIAAAYNIDGNALANAFTSISFMCKSPTNDYQVLPIRVYALEQQTSIAKKNYVQVPLSASSSALPVNIDVVFKMENTRPTLKAYTSNVADIAVGERRTLTLGEYFTDIDNSGGITPSTHEIKRVIIPEHEIVMLDKLKAKVEPPSAVDPATGKPDPNIGYYNVGEPTSDAFGTTAQTSTPTGFTQDIAYNITSGAADSSREAFMRFEYTASGLTVTGLRPSYSQYRADRAKKPGHFYLMLHITDKLDEADDGIWLPIAFRIGATQSATHAPVSTVTAMDVGITSQSPVTDYPKADGKAGDAFYFAPMSIGYNGNRVVGARKDGAAYKTDDLQPLAMDGDNFATVTGANTRSGKLNELLTLSTPMPGMSIAEAAVKSMTGAGPDTSAKKLSDTHWENQYIAVEILPIYIPKSYFTTPSELGAANAQIGRLVVGGTAEHEALGHRNLTLGDEGEYYVIDGLKITLKSATMGRFFYVETGVTDTFGSSATGIRIAVRVSNAAPTVKPSDSVYTFGTASEYVNSAYSYDAASDSTPTLKYKIPLNSTIAITPYDVMTDADMNIAGGVTSADENRFTLNGLSGRYNAATGTLTTGRSDYTDADGRAAFKGILTDRMTSDELSARNGATKTLLDKIATTERASDRVTNTTTYVKTVSSGTGGAAVGDATASDARVPRDRLFFERNAAEGSAYEYDPADYASSAIAVTQQGTTGFLTLAFGSSLKYGDELYKLDYLIITAITRTTRTATIELTVRDRYGRAQGGAPQLIRIQIDVVNTKPRVKDGTPCGELSVKPVLGEGEKVKYPSAMEYGANGNDAASGLMQDHDGDEPEFMQSRGAVVANGTFIAAYKSGIVSAKVGDASATYEDKPASEITSFDALDPKYFTDTGESTGTALTAYVTATLLGKQKLGVNAVSSTRAIASGVYVCFFATDNNGGTTLGYVQVEVHNTAPELNTGADGFDKADRLWNVVSTSKADITRARYIVGSDNARDILKEKGIDDRIKVNAVDVKYIATDVDGRHNRVVLSRMNADGTYKNLTESDYAGAVPNIANASTLTGMAVAVPSTAEPSASTDASAAVAVFTRTGDSFAAGAPTGFSAALYFVYGGALISRDALLDKLTSDVSAKAECFDARGRFTLDFALRLQATNGFASGTDLGIILSVRDAADVGGDTAGEDTAYTPERDVENDGFKQNAKVSGRLEATVYQHISQTGIRSVNEYLSKNDGYYTVEYKENYYLSTYDGDDTDGTLANKATLGTKYTGANSANDLTYAFKYKDTIEVTAAPVTGKRQAVGDAGIEYESVYVPMSYFGQLSTLATPLSADGTVTYPTEYVGYDVYGASSTDLTGAVNVDNLSAIQAAITLSDGVNVWSGAELNKNPYVTIDTYDLRNGDGADTNKRFTPNAYSVEYYNNRMAVETKDANGNGIGFEKLDGNKQNFSTDGTIMYLAEQASKLQEHNFGLTFTKKNMRTGRRDLSLAIKLAKYHGDGKVWLENGVIKDTDRATAEVKLRVENSKLDLFADNDIVKYDADKGTYYTDITLKSTETVSYELVRRSSGIAESSSVRSIQYYDDDYYLGAETYKENYRDAAYFYTDSFMSTDKWREQSLVGRVTEKTDATADAKLVNTIITDDGRAQRSVLNYLGTETGGKYMPNGGIYGRMSGGFEGYSSYFNASVTDGTRLNIVPLKKTRINEIAFSRIDDLKSVDKTSKADVTAAYARRGLVAEYGADNDDPLKPDRVYYPFKVLIYDSYNVGFGGGSYVAMELRIEVVNGAPSLLRRIGEDAKDNDTGIVHATGRQYSVNLAVGNSVSVNLYDIVSDTDMFVDDKGINELATKKKFEEEASGVVLETGDYLALSPVDDDAALKARIAGERDGYDRTNVTSYKAADDTTHYLRNGGGFVLKGSTFNIGNKAFEDTASTERDVVMWMASDSSGVPYSNTITFTVNRRSSAMYGTSYVSIDRYVFTLSFKDSSGEATGTVSFIVNVTNQAPTITTNARNFKMRSGDELTVLVGYYDVFTGGTDKALAYSYSNTSKMVADRSNLAGYGDTRGDGPVDGGYWKFADITTAKVADKLISDSTVNRPANGSRHLGYLSLANDDTPWQMRITGYTRTGTTKNVELSDPIQSSMIMLPNESTPNSSTRYAVAMRIIARSACTNVPIDLTISDGEGGSVTCTLTFTVISSKPEARSYADEIDRQMLESSGLEGVPDDNSGYMTGVYNLYTTAAETGGRYNIGSKTVTAKKTNRIYMRNVANDPDGSGETDNMTLFGDGYFTIGEGDNKRRLVSGADGTYNAGYFTVSIDPDRKSFTITATGYNPVSAYEALGFTIADYGNSTAYENSLEITIRVCTLYSDITNKTAATTSRYDEYLSGSSVVKVKSFDEYYDPSAQTKAEPSRYAHIAMSGNVGTDGNTVSPITDLDVTEKGAQRYGVRLYAFMTVDADGRANALSVATLKSMFKREPSKNTFMLNNTYNDYLIGGVDADGAAVRPNNNAKVLLAAVNRYATFGFDADGAAVLFEPVASTLGAKNILLYVQAEKPLDPARRILVEGAAMQAGELFVLDVIDSAPVAVASEWSARGKRDDTVGHFKVFDANDRYGTMFVDSDAGDSVRISGMVNGRLADDMYAEVMKDSAGLDWKADEASKKPRAIDIVLDANGLLAVKINRRIDSADARGKYAPEVTLTLDIKGEDRAGKTATTKVHVTVVNSAPEAVEKRVSKYDEKTLVGYAFEKSLNGDYQMDVSLRLSVPLDVALADILTDADMADAEYDADSYRFVMPKTTTRGYKYLCDEIENVSWYAMNGDGTPNLDNTKPLATAEPLGTKMNRTGIRFTATATERDLTATMYVRVIDRSGDADAAENGIVIKINIVVMNDAPITRAGKETTTLYMMGSETAAPTGMLFFIGDFVTDKNDSDVLGDTLSKTNVDTCLRWFSQEARMTSKIYSLKHSSIIEGMSAGFGEASSSALFDVTTPELIDKAMYDAYVARMGADSVLNDASSKDYHSYAKDEMDNKYNQWFVITPRAGYYGSGAVDITVSDGNTNVKYDTLTTTFRLEINVLCNPEEVINVMNSVEIACSKTKSIDIRTLMPEIKNKLALDGDDKGSSQTETQQQPAQPQALVSASAESGSSFSQHEYYTVKSIALQNKSDSDFAEFVKLDDSLWQVKAKNRVTHEPLNAEVTFELKTGTANGGKSTFKKYFYLSIVPNQPPQLKSDKVQFSKYKEGEKNPFDLDGSNTITLYASQLFKDPDDDSDVGAALRILDVKSQVSAIVRVAIKRDPNGANRQLEIQFLARGESEITVTVTDETDTPIVLKFLAINLDLPEASLWVRAQASFQANTVTWIIVIGCALLFILFVLLIITLIIRRKRAREELEALLVSEMEIEDTMLRLAGGPSPTDYRSYGYLPPSPDAGGIPLDPSVLLSAGNDAPAENLAALPPGDGE